VRVDLDTWRKLATSEGGLHDADAWAEQIGQLGVDRDSHVVVCGEALPDTARVWWLLKYAGISEVAILNGGWPSWNKDGRRQEKSVPEVTKTDFKPDFQADRLEEIDALKVSIKRPNVKLVDTRSDGEYTGETVRGKRGGRISGAVHLDWSRLVTSDGRFKTTSELRNLFRESNILPTDTAVCY
jgi:thiosulfate/3-mercaptopyruvate sulfurtransferase